MRDFLETFLIAAAVSVVLIFFVYDDARADEESVWLTTGMWSRHNDEEKHHYKQKHHLIKKDLS